MTRRCRRFLLLSFLTLFAYRNWVFLAQYIGSSTNLIDADNALPQMKQTESPRRDDSVYCMLPFVWTPESTKKRKDILETWGQRCDKIRFMIDPIVKTEDGNYTDAREFPKGTLPDDVVIIEDMTRPWHTCEEGKECRHIWEKVWRSWIWVDEHELNSADWFVKTDWDTYLFPDNLRYFIKLKGWTPNEHHYFGQQDYHRDPTFISGAAVVFSSKTLHEVADVYRKMPRSKNLKASTGKCMDSAGSHEEVITANCLKEHLGVYPEHTRDAANREHITLEMVHHQLKWNRTEQGEWWFWANKPKDVGQLDECCAHRPIAFHGYKNNGDFYDIEKEFYGSWNNTKDRPKWDNTTRRYFDKVKLAMQQL